jgi:hypothetical protein
MKKVPSSVTNKCSGLSGGSHYRVFTHTDLLAGGVSYSTEVPLIRKLSRAAAAVSTRVGHFTGNFLRALSGDPQLQIGVFTDTTLVKERHYLLRLQV